MYFWLCRVFVAAQTSSLAVVSRGYSPVAGRASHCGAFSCYTVRAPGCSGFGSRGAQAQGLSWSTACRIFPDQGSNPYLLHWQVDSLPLSHLGSPSLETSNTSYALTIPQFPARGSPLTPHSRTQLPIQHFHLDG